MTKADKVEDGEYSLWLKILRNQSQYPFHHGYYVTRQLTTKERESGLVSWNTSRETEQLFFSAHPVWRLEHPERLGTKNLTIALSRLLAEHIRKRSVLSLPILMFSLPTLRSALDMQRRMVQKQLDQLPHSLADDPQRADFVTHLQQLSLISVAMNDMKVQDDGGTAFSEMSRREQFGPVSHASDSQTKSQYRRDTSRSTSSQTPYLDSGMATLIGLANKDSETLSDKPSSLPGVLIKARGQLRGLERWEGLSVPSKVTHFQYNIKWKVPIGSGTYGRVLEVSFQDDVALIS